MKPKNERIPIEELRGRLDYDPETGVLRWRKRHGVAGYIKKSGYREMEWYMANLQGLRHGGQSVYLLAHRVAWALATGAWPAHEIDHRNGNRDDNRLANLRPATSAENKQNYAPPRGKPWSLARRIQDTSV